VSDPGASGTTILGVGLPMLLLVAGAIQIAIIIVILLIDPTQTRRALGDIERKPKDPHVLED